MDPNALSEPDGFFSGHEPKRIQLREVPVPGVTWAPIESVEAFFGKRDVRLVFSQLEKLYLVSWESGAARSWELSQGDETPDFYAPTYIPSPLFSPDGKWVTYATDQGYQGFVMNVENPALPSWRLPLSAGGLFYNTADPHFVTRSGSNAVEWIYFANTDGQVDFIDRCGAFDGYTYRVALMNDSTLDSLQPTGLPGAFRGGISRDGYWAGTTYGETGLFDTRDSLPPRLLAGRAQKCNASMNPFPTGSLNTDFLMLLAFGGTYQSPLGPIQEAQHENLWIYSKEDLAVWRARTPGAGYYRWNKPEWSTHPRFASAVAARKGEEGQSWNCDLFSVKLPDLANARRDTLYEAEGNLALGKGRFSEGTYSHLWIKP